MGAGLRYKGVGLDASFMYWFENGLSFEADYIFKVDLSYGFQGGGEVFFDEIVAEKENVCNFALKKQHRRRQPCLQKCSHGVARVEADAFSRGKLLWFRALVSDKPPIGSEMFKEMDGGDPSKTCAVFAIEVFFYHPR